MDHISKEYWAGQSSDVRVALRKRFDLRATESPVVVDDRVISDGISTDTLRSVFNEDRMREELGKKAPADASCEELFQCLVAEVMNGATKEPIVEKTSPEPAAPVAPKPAPRKRKSK